MQSWWLLVAGAGQEEAQKGWMEAAQAQSAGQEESWRDWVTVGEGGEQEDNIQGKVVEWGEPKKRMQLAFEALLESSPLAL